MTGFGDPDVTHFEVKNGVLVGDPSAVVHQTQYDIDAPVIRAWDKFSCKVDVRITDYADSTSMGPDFGSETMILLISRRQTANPMRERFGTTIMIV